ncbi:DegV family protein [Virgibacillus halophilus]|uniref:DegV family protein n=1 Tax=Tigheibacillus halophilus TaxID=361280 RepID=A0ABU5C7R0_9BACI|nr:DegV family protein [Virgibacillus halophilus]
MKIQIMTDGGADLAQKMLDKLHINIVPLYLHFSDGQFKTHENIDLDSFYQKIKDNKEIPNTSAPSPHDFYEAYKAVDTELPIIMLSLSKGLSSTYENAVAGKDMLLEEQPDRKIEVINTKTASCGMALLLHETAKIGSESASFEQIVAHLRERVEQTTTLFMLKTLENLILGGRLDKVKGTIAKTLNIKLLMRGSEEGTIEVTEKIRGEKKALRRFIEQIGDHAKNFDDKVITLAHGNDEERAQSVLREIMNRYPFKDGFLMPTGPLISSYGGEGALVISFFADSDNAV